MKYKPTPGASYGQEKAQEIGEYLEQVQAEFGRVDAPLLYSLGWDTPIGKMLERNKNEAAYQYNLVQIRHIIRHLNVIMVKDGKEVEVRALHFLITKQEVEGKQVPIRVYKQTEYLLEVEEEKNFVLQEIIGYFVELRNKYRDYRELDPIFEAIDLVSMDLMEVV